MSTHKSEVEIQAVNLAQQWYSLSAADLPQLSALLPQYLKCFDNEQDKSEFLEETLRIAKELVDGPKSQAGKSESYDDFKSVIQQHLSH